MGVNRCSRNGCENIMCDTYIPAVGLICNNCQEEFKRFSGISMYTEEDLIEELKLFMDMEKEEEKEINEEYIQRFFERHTN